MHNGHMVDRYLGANNCLIHGCLHEGDIWHNLVGLVVRTEGDWLTSQPCLDNMIGTITCWLRLCLLIS